MNQQRGWWKSLDSDWNSRFTANRFEWNYPSAEPHTGWSTKVRPRLCALSIGLYLVPTVFWCESNGRSRLDPDGWLITKPSLVTNQRWKPGEWGQTNLRNFGHGKTMTGFVRLIDTGFLMGDPFDYLWLPLITPLIQGCQGWYWLTSSGRSYMSC